MPVLSNVRHERFCQELAKGKTNAEAYELAGYESTGATASAAATRLLKDVKIQGRLAELQERGLKRAEITVDSIRDMLLEDRTLARELGQASAAVSAVEKLAKLYGHMVDRKEIRTGHLDELPADSITELREQLIAERARRANSGSGSEATRKPH